MCRSFTRKTKRSYVGPFISRSAIPDDIFSPNNSKFGDYVDRICRIELQITDTTDVQRHLSLIT